VLSRELVVTFDSIVHSTPNAKYGLTWQGGIERQGITFVNVCTNTLPRFSARGAHGCRRQDQHGVATACGRPLDQFQVKMPEGVVRCSYDWCERGTSAIRRLSGSKTACSSWHGAVQSFRWHGLLCDTGSLSASSLGSNGGAGSWSAGSTTPQLPELCPARLQSKFSSKPIRSSFLAGLRAGR